MAPPALVPAVAVVAAVAVCAGDVSGEATASLMLLCAMRAISLCADRASALRMSARCTGASTGLIECFSSTVSKVSAMSRCIVAGEGGSGRASGARRRERSAAG